MDRVELRECGVYTLPDGRSYVAIRTGTNCYSLFATRAWADGGRADYLLHGGRLLTKGVPTRWRGADLRDTGRTAEPKDL